MTKDMIGQYFNLALEHISEYKVINNFTERLTEIYPCITYLELFKNTCEDWRRVFRTEHKEVLKQIVFRLL